MQRNKEIKPIGKSKRNCKNIDIIQQKSQSQGRDSKERRHIENNY